MHRVKRMSRLYELFESDPESFDLSARLTLYSGRKVLGSVMCRKIEVPEKVKGLNARILAPASEKFNPRASI